MGGWKAAQTGRQEGLPYGQGSLQTAQNQDNTLRRMMPKATPQSKPKKGENLPLPKGWQWVRLCDHVSKVGSGVTPSGGHTAYHQCGTPLIRSQNIHINRFEPEGLVFISTEQDEKMAGSRVQPDDVLLNITGASIGRVCHVPAEICPANVNQHVSIIRSDGSLDSWFLAFYLASPSVQKFIMDSQAGATRQALTKAMIEEFQIPFIRLPEQRRIAARLREQLAEVAQARAAIAAQLDATHLLPTAQLRAVFDGPAARSWPRRPFSEVCEITAKQVDPKLPEYGSLPHVNGENIEGGTCRLFEVRSAAEDGMTSGKYLFEAADVLYSKLRPYLRKVAVAPFRGLCSADMYPIRVNPTVLDARFTAWMLLSEDFTKYAIAKSERSRMPKLNREQLFSYDAPVPPLSDQRRIAAQIEHAVATSRELDICLTTRLTTVEHLPAALLREAFSGRT